MTVQSGWTKTPPLKPAMGVSRCRASLIIFMPRGGRPLVMAKRMPRSRKTPDGVLCALGQNFVLGDKRAIDVGEDERDGLVDGVWFHGGGMAGR